MRDISEALMSPFRASKVDLWRCRAGLSESHLGWLKLIKIWRKRVSLAQLKQTFVGTT